MRVPKVTEKRYLQTLIRAIDSGEELPRNWEVDLYWRNPKTRHGATKRWRSDDFMSAIMESRSGFVDIVRGALVRKLRRLA